MKRALRRAGHAPSPAIADQVEHRVSKARRLEHRLAKMEDAISEIRNGLGEVVERSVAAALANAAVVPLPAPTVAEPVSIQASKSRANDRSRSDLKRQREECRRDLGELFVAQEGADDLDSAELQRLHAALRAVTLEAEPLIPLVRQQLRSRGRAALDVAATSVRRAA